MLKVLSNFPYEFSPLVEITPPEKLVIYTREIEKEDFEKLYPASSHAEGGLQITDENVVAPIKDLNSILFLDNTQRSTWVECKRKWYWKDVRHLSPLTGSTALRYGKSWHAGQDAFYAHIKEHGWTRDGSSLEAAITAIKTEWDKCCKIESFFDDYRTLENCVKSFLMYVSHFTLDEGILEVVDTERAFKVLMKNQFGEPYWFMGRIDTEVALDRRNWIFEHKTTGQPIDTQSKRLNRSAQGMGYTYALKRIYGSSEKLYYDDAPEGILIVLHHLSSTKSKTTGNYGAPRIDFRRCPQMYGDYDLLEWKVTMDTVATEIQHHIEKDYFPQNHDSCYNYGSCPYLPLCDQQCQPKDVHTYGFRVEENPWTPMQDAAQIVEVTDFDGEVIA